jgi:hypothetical protein
LAIRPGVVDEDVEGLRPRDRVREGSQVRHVDGKCLRPPSPGADRLGRNLDLARGPRGERHISTGLGQRLRSREPNAAARPGDERTPAIEAEGWKDGAIGHDH